MERLSRLHVSPEWEAALLACLDVPPRRPGSRRKVWVLFLVLFLAGAAGIVVWFVR